MSRLQNKIAVITGAGTGIGRACMQLFAAQGATVVGCSRTQKNLDDTLALVTGDGGTGMVVAADLSSEAGAQKLIDATLAEYGRIDVLVNAAGVGYSWANESEGSMGSVTDTPPDKWREVMAIDLDSVYLVSRLAIQAMQKQGSGAVVNIASVLGLVGNPDAHAYTAAKGAIINLTRSMCATYTADGIRTNCVAPGFIDTPMIASHVSLLEDEAVADRLCPMHRPGQPEEIAQGCLFLATDEASYVNGTTLVIDGGTLARI